MKQQTCAVVGRSGVVGGGGRRKNNPGRGELDDRQEINFVACMKALLEIGYDGYVGHEFIPTRDPLQGLPQAVSLCDV